MGLISSRGHTTRGDADDGSEAEGRAKRARRQFTDELKAGVVRLVLDEGKTVAQVARDRDLTPGPRRLGEARASGSSAQR